MCMSDRAPKPARTADWRPRAKRIALAGIALLGACAGAAPAHADQTPRPVAGDTRVRTVAYRADDVVSIEGRYGYLTMIELSEDERIENVAIGDSLAWQVVPSRSAHMLFLKPVEQNAATNLAVVTNRRTYAFALSARAPQRTRSGAPGADGLYRVIFSYPEEEARRAELAAARARAETIARDRAASAIDAARRSTVWNSDYRMRGDRDARPGSALDDGRFTYFQFAAQAEIPAIFAVEDDGAETLVNYVVRGPYVVVERLAPAWRLRAGKVDARIVNRRWRRHPDGPVVASGADAGLRDGPGASVAPTPVIVRDPSEASAPTRPSTATVWPSATRTPTGSPPAARRPDDPGVASGRVRTSDMIAYASDALPRPSAPFAAAPAARDFGSSTRAATSTSLRASPRLPAPPRAPSRTQAPGHTGSESRDLNADQSSGPFRDEVHDEIRGQRRAPPP